MSIFDTYCPSDEDLPPSSFKGFDLEEPEEEEGLEEETETEV